MLYICADDFGLDIESDEHIKECILASAVNKVSVFAAENIKIPQDVLPGVHINLVEGVAADKSVKIIVDKNGNFKYSFGGLLLKSLLPGRKTLKKEIYCEISKQINLFKKSLPENALFCVDTHQHTHMIPLVFEALLQVLKNESGVSYLRIPAEPIIPYIKAVSLWHTYSLVNILKQFTLKFLWLFSKRKFKKSNIKSALFMGIMFSGKMDEKRVLKVLPDYIKIAKRKKSDIELLFHPGYKEKAIDTKFSKFYMSSGRITEYNSVMKLDILEKEGSVL